MPCIDVAVAGVVEAAICNKFFKFVAVVVGVMEAVVVVDEADDVVDPFETGTATDLFSIFNGILCTVLVVFKSLLSFNPAAVVIVVVDVTPVVAFVFSLSLSFNFAL